MLFLVIDFLFLVLFLFYLLLSSPITLLVSDCSSVRYMCGFHSIAIFFGDLLNVFLVYMIIIILVITFMQVIYNYIPETNHVSRVYRVVAAQYLQLCYMYYYFAHEIGFVLFVLRVQCPISLSLLVP
jgi:hypothetical protein